MDGPVWLKTVHFCANVHFKDRPLSPFWTVHFGPDSKLNSDSNPEVKSRVEKIRTWRKEQIDSMNEILSQIDSHYETLNELLSKRQEGLANEVCEHFEKR